MKKYKYFANVITFVGLVAGLVGVYSSDIAWALPLCLLSLACDVLDGVVAREFGGESAFGARFDWGTDCLLASLALVRLTDPLIAVPALTLLAVWHAISGGEVRFSGRAAAFALLLFQLAEAQWGA